MVHESKKSDSARKKSANVTTKTNSESGQSASPTPPGPLPHPSPLFVFLGIFERKTLGVRAEKTRVRLRTRWVLTSFYFSFLNTNRIIAVFEAAHFRFYRVL